MKIYKKIWLNSVALIGLMLITASVYGNANDSRIVMPGQQLFNKSYNELASDWANWLVREPIATNPAFDPDGRFCDINQKGNVWFLASTFENVVDRTCKIPADKAIFLSLGGLFISFPELLDSSNACLKMGTPDEQVRCDVNDDVALAPNISFEVAIDGVQVKDVFAYRTQSQPGGFTLHVPDPSLLTELFGLSPGDRSLAVVDGYYMYLKPLKPGNHKLKVIITNPDQSKAGVNYTLLIGGNPR